MRRRRKSKYTWMPTLGGVTTQADSTIGTIPFGIVFSPNASSASSSIFVDPLVPDQTSFPDQASVDQETLRDFTEGQDWLCKRIVGKIHLGLTQKNALDLGAGRTTWKYVTVAAAFFVGRSKDDNPDQPDYDTIEIDPLCSQNVRNPWMWRRVWTLENGLVPVDFTNGISNYGFPSSNISYGSVLDGPHIDIKVSRRIRREERLWFVASAIGWNKFFGEDGESVTDVFNIVGLLDYRILGAMRRSNNRSVF